jgi:hypothetical protein
MARAKRAGALQYCHGHDGDGTEPARLKDRVALRNLRAVEALGGSGLTFYFFWWINK